jgi:uncharacterized protein
LSIILCIVSILSGTFQITIERTYMTHNLHVMLITQTEVKPNKNDAFEAILKKMSSLITTFDGYVSQDIKRPNPPLQLDWIIIQYFDSVHAAKEWLQSDARFNLLKEALPLLVGIDSVYIMQQNHHDQDSITAAITNKIDPKYEQKFLDWQIRITPIQSKFPGFIGYKLEKPQPGINDSWTAIVTFDTDEHLDAWIKSPERQKMIKELHTFTGESHIEKVYAGFAFWFNQSKGLQRSIWKENMLVLLTLYPVVFLLSYIQNPAMAYGVPFWLALFFSNLISTVILGSITVPWLMKQFQWWLNPKKGCEQKYALLGTLVVVTLYVITMLMCWILSRYR